MAVDWRLIILEMQRLLLTSLKINTVCMKSVVSGHVLLKAKSHKISLNVSKLNVEFCQKCNFL